jgi:hypothetical protein
MVPNPSNAKEMVIKNVLIPFGSALLLRADIPHSGCYGSVNNARLQAVLIPDSTKKYKQQNLGYVKRNELRKAGITVRRELSPKVSPEHMIVAAKSIATEYLDTTYWKTYLESVKGGIARRWILRFGIDKDRMKKLKQEFEKKQYKDDTATDYEVDTADEGEKTHYWMGKKITTKIKRFGAPGLELDLNNGEKEELQDGEKKVTNNDPNDMDAEEEESTRDV